MLEFQCTKTPNLFLVQIWTALHRYIVVAQSSDITTRIMVEVVRLSIIDKY